MTDSTTERLDRKVPKGTRQAWELGPCETHEVHKDKCNVLLLGQGNPKHQSKLSHESTENKPSEKD